MPHQNSTHDIVRDTDEMPWACAPQKGVSYKSLRFDQASGAGAVLIHMTPNSVYPSHKLHAGLDVLVLDGSLEIAGTTVTRGQYAFVAEGQTQTPATKDGCVLFATFAGRIENLHG
jgi:hypothetical protein